jgi:hypothetical protein
MSPDEPERAGDIFVKILAGWAAFTLADHALGLGRFLSPPVSD